GVIFNRVGGDLHAEWLADAVRATCRARVLGALRSEEALTLPERHLGLVTGAEGVLSAERRRRLAEACTRWVDLDALRLLARPSISAQAPRPPAPRAPRARIGVARDVAFQFYYPENLDLLREAGAELIFWSPLDDPAPLDVDGLYLGGGY